MATMKVTITKTIAAIYLVSCPLMLGTGAANQSDVKLKAPPVPNLSGSQAKQTKSTGANASKLTPGAVAPASTPPAEQVTLQSRDLSSNGPKWQLFSDYLSIPKGVESMPLYLTFTNGPSAAARFSDVRISLNGKGLYTLSDFNAQPVLNRNLAGLVSPGNNLLSVQLFGPAGARFNWKLTTAKLVVTKVSPNVFGFKDKVIVEGQNFSDRPNATQVFIDNKAIGVVNAKSNSLELKLPSDILPGKANLTVVVGNQRSAAVPVTIKGAPEIQSINRISTAPGQPITITGTGFSQVASENQVTIGGYPAEITGCSNTRIDCIVPMALDPISPTWNLPVKVKTNNVDAKDPRNAGTINIQSRVF